MKAVLLLAVLVAVAAAVSIKEGMRPLGREIKAHPCNFQENCKVHDFKRVSRANGADMVTITLWTSQKGFAASCPSMLMEVSDPGILPPM